MNESDLEYELFGRETIYDCLLIPIYRICSYYFDDFTIVDRYNKLIKLNNLYITKYTLSELKTLSINKLDDHYYRIERIIDEIMYYKRELIKRAMPICKQKYINQYIDFIKQNKIVG